MMLPGKKLFIKGNKMKHKISIFLSAIFLSVFLWAQNPTANFPYYYYDSSERSFAYYAEELYGYSQSIEDNSEHTIKLYKSGYTYYIWVKYKSGQAPSEKAIKETLKENKDVAANLDQRLDSKQYSDMDVCIIFTDSNNQLICSAQYDD